MVRGDPSLVPDLSKKASSFSSLRIIYILKFIYLIYLFLAVLCLHCCARAFSSCSEWGLLLVAVRGLFVVVASLVAECRLQ